MRAEETNEAVIEKQVDVLQLTRGEEHQAWQGQVSLLSLQRLPPYLERFLQVLSD